jgi:hypothetical protein
MSYVKFNPNPNNKSVGDCVIRALSLATNTDWETTYIKLVLYGFKMADIPSSNQVWGNYLIDNGFKKYPCPDCITIRDFCNEHNNGVYVIGTGTHVVTCIDGNYYDSWDSGDEMPVYYFKRGDLK